jgi:hypothetical protein
MLLRSARRATFLAAALGSLAFAPTLVAQLSYGGSPPTYSNPLQTTVPTVTMAPVDVSKLMDEDALRAKNAGPFRFGAELAVDIGNDNSGVTDTLADGTTIWRVRILSPGALSINLLFSQYDLPDGAELYVYNDGFRDVLGSYNALNFNPSGQFAIQPIAGEAITLEYVEPSYVDKPGVIRVGTVVHGYRDILSAAKAGIPLKAAGACEVDVNCPAGVGWEATRRACARLIIGGGLCTGSLINNSSNNGDRLFITANHCGALNSAVFQFRYEKSGCGTGSAPTNFTVQGSTQLVSSSSLDHRLVRINSVIPATYNVYYPGWDRATTMPGGAVAIHHPQGDVKKISFENNALGTSGTDWRVLQWDTGVTEPGSSGSPLYSKTGKKYIGALYGGASYCGFPFDDFYPKLANYFNLSKAYLDPTNSNATSIGDYDPNAACGSVTYAGTGCLGSNFKVPDLSLTGCLADNGQVNFSITNGFPNQQAFMYIGLTTASVVIPPSTCTLLVSPLVTIGPFPLNISGTFSLSTTLGDISPGTVHGQVVCTDPGTPLGATFTKRMTMTFQ